MTTHSTSQQPEKHPFVSAVQWLGFLSDEMRVCETDQMSLRRVAALMNQPRSHLESTFVAGNMVALLLFRFRRLDDAKALCRSAVRYALAHRRDSCWPEFATYAFQPEINLLRIEGYAGDLGVALGGLAQLDRLTQGDPAHFTDLILDDSDIAVICARGFDIKKLARNVMVVETCKILWRRRATAELRGKCQEFQHRWPQLMASGGPGHASEGPWLLGDGLEGPTGQAALARAPDTCGPEWQRRTAHVRLLHAAAHMIQAGHTETATSIAQMLFHRRPWLSGPYASPLTPIRWDASLMDTMIRLGILEQARCLARDIRASLGQFSDQVFREGITERLSVLGISPPDPEPVNISVIRHELELQYQRIMKRLEV